ncbi:MAG: HAMP domain-containing protein [Clostridiales bacterium]|nr:HAMP domain-containing protein [Clostridiales bacterium]
MAKDNKVRIYNRLFYKLYANYAIMLLVTAVLICLIFMKLYYDTTMENHRDQLVKQAYKVSERMTEFIEYGRTEDFLEYLNTLIEINDMDVWTVSNPASTNPMNESLATNSYEEFLDSEIYADYAEILQSAFSNQMDNQTRYDEIYQTQTITVAVPVYGVNRGVVGAVLLKSPVEGQRAIISSSLSLIVFSSIVALGISFLIVIVFATELSIPISRMRVTALELAAGKYRTKTGIKRKDEIGDLAKTIDILSEKLLENEIQRKNLEQMRLDFFANVSHELRTPITVLRGYTETLVDGVVTDEEKVAQYYERMLSECKSMERLVGDLLVLSKMQNPDFVIEKEPVNLIQVFDDIIRSANAIAEKKNITIDFKKDHPMYMILGDYDRLRQMFMVILDNAIKFSKENKTVYINIMTKDKIIVSIRDEGIGIEAADLEHIFEKFYKSSLRQNANGTGLGLAIAKQIALKHEGNILVNSQPGVGSEFIFSFPIYKIEK